MTTSSNGRRGAALLRRRAREREILDATRANEGVIRDGHLVGGIGVVGLPGDSQRAEAVAVTGAFGALGSADGPIAPVPQYPLPFPGNVFIDGIRLPFLGPDQKLRFNDDGLPIGLENIGPVFVPFFAKSRADEGNRNDIYAHLALRNLLLGAARGSPAVAAQVAAAEARLPSYAERGHDEQTAQRDPEKAEPERANLPPEVGFEPRPAHVASFHVVEDNRDD